MSLSETIWRPIGGYEDCYEVSNTGYIRSVRRGIILSMWGANGYLCVTLKVNGKKKNLYVHRLVASAFCDNPQGMPEVNHKDGDKIHNNATNLEWVSSAQNKQHAINDLGMQFGMGTATPVIGRKGENVLEYGSIRSASRDGFNPTAIWMALDGRIKTHRGFSWERAA